MAGGRSVGRRQIRGDSGRAAVVGGRAVAVVTVLGGEDEPVGLAIDRQPRPLGEFSGQQPVGQPVLESLLDDPFQWPGPVLPIVSLPGQQLTGGVCDLQFVALLGEPTGEFFELEVDDASDVAGVQR